MKPRDYLTFPLTPYGNQTTTSTTYVNKKPTFKLPSGLWEIRTFVILRNDNSVNTYFQLYNVSDNATLFTTIVTSNNFAHTKSEWSRLRIAKTSTHKTIGPRLKVDSGTGYIEKKGWIQCRKFEE